MASETFDVDALFQLPLADFTTARNTLATSLHKSGRKEEAARVKALPKPSISVWAVNQLYWRMREAFDRLITAGARLRQAQASQLAGHAANIRDPLAAHREALNDLSRHAVTVLAQANHQASPDVMRRVTTTLEGLAARGLLPDAPPAGRLTADVDAPGFETFSALVPRSGDGGPPKNGDSRVLAFRSDRRGDTRAVGGKKPTAEALAHAEARRAAARAAARAGALQAAGALRLAQRDARKTEAALKKAAARLKELEQAKRHAEAALEKVAAQADTARVTARKAAADADADAHAVKDAERAVESARRELTALD